MDPTTNCGNCHCCLDGQTVNVYGIKIPIVTTRMVLCPICGNKRCPKATDHENDCTGSNEPGQRGSIYGGLGHNG